jgi:hypothetical protein
VLQTIIIKEFLQLLNVRNNKIYKIAEIVYTSKMEESFHALGCEVLTAVVMKSNIFWDLTPYSPLKVNRSFGEHIAYIFRAED